MRIVRIPEDFDPASIAFDPSSPESQDSLLADYVGLTDAALRQRQDIERGRFIAETTLVVERALDAGYRPRSFFLHEKHLPDLEPRLGEFPDAPVFVGSEQTLQRIAGFHLHRGALASMWRKLLPALDDVLRNATRIAVVEDIVDHTNIGALFRSAAALGIDAVILSPRCADPLYRRAIRTSMGTVFSMPFTRATQWPGAIQSLHDSGFTTAALALSQSAEPIDAFAAQRAEGERLALFLGSEGPGLSQAVLESVQHHVIIPMSAGTDSLNVASASAVAFWETRRRIG